MRKMLNYPPLFLVFNLIVGIVCARKFSFELNELIVLLSFSALAFVILKFFNRWISFPRWFEMVLFACSMILVGIASYAMSDHRNRDNYYMNYNLLDREQTTLLKITEVLKSNTSTNRFKAHIVQVESAPSSGEVLLNIRRDSLIDVGIGAQLFCRIKLFPIQKARNPHEFDYANYLENQQIYHQVYLEPDEFKILKGAPNSILTNISSYRAKLISKLSQQRIPMDRFAVMSALLLGERNYLATDLKKAYIDAGAIHILAISGLHIGILFLLLSVLFRPLHAVPFGRFFSQLLILMVLWLFAVLAGLSASVVRAVTMFSFISIGMFLNRKHSVYHSLIASAFLLLVIRPRFLFEVGFQLSYTAVFSIVWLQPKFESLWKPRYRIPHYFWKLLTVSSAAQLGVLPLSLFYFHQFPSLFFVSNLVIVPLLGVLLGFGIFVLILVEFELPFEQFILGYHNLIGLLNRFIELIAGFEQFVVKEIYWSVSLLVTSYVVIISFFKFIETKQRLRLLIAGFAIMSFYGVLVVETQGSFEQRELVVFHRSRATIIGELRGSKLKLIGLSDTTKPEFIKSYSTYKRVKEINYEGNVPHAVFTGREPLVIIDSLGLYQFKSVQSPTVLLRNSPRINVHRMIKELQPSLILADGSNYKSFVKRWRETALKTKTPFHDTSQKGAFILE